MLDFLMEDEGCQIIQKTKTLDGEKVKVLDRRMLARKAIKYTVLVSHSQTFHHIFEGATVDIEHCLDRIMATELAKTITQGYTNKLVSKP